MSFEDGWAALHLEMPRRVPRTEYSASEHWELITAITHLAVGPDSPPQVKRRAQDAFHVAWNFDLFWSVLVTAERDLAGCRTVMGHGAYAAGGGDFNPHAHCPFDNPEQVLAFDPWQVYGRRDPGVLVRRFETHYRDMRAAHPTGVGMTGVYITLMSGLIDIFGWDMLLLAAGTDPARFGALADRYASWIQQYFDALAEARVPVVMVHDDIAWSSGPFLRPDWYRRYLFPNYRRFVAPLRDSGKIVLFTSDGNYTPFIDDVVSCGVHGLFLEPTTDMACVAERYGRTHVFVGNADTRILLSGPRSAIRAEVERCLAIGRDCPGFFLAVGNHIPANTPVGNAIYYNRVYERLCRR